MYVQARRGGAGDHSRVPESRDCSRNIKEPLADDARSCVCSKTECISPVGEERVQQQLWLGTDVVLGSAVAAASIVHTGLTGTFPLGDVEPTIRVPMELSLPKDACLQVIRQVATDKHETSAKCNWLYTSNVFQVSKHGFWSHCSQDE